MAFCLCCRRNLLPNTTRKSCKTKTSRRVFIVTALVLILVVTTMRSFDSSSSSCPPRSTTSSTAGAGGAFVFVDAAGIFGNKNKMQGRAKKRAINDQQQDEGELDGDDDDQDQVLAQQKHHYLVSMIGKKFYSIISKRKYKLYAYVIFGRSLPSENDMIAVLATICNVLYCSLVFWGFWFWPRGKMLIFTMLTLYVGPAIILILIGIVAITIAAFAIYPVSSVLVMWLWYFLTSNIAQIIGRKLGLDVDQDGDVDVMDLLHYVAYSTKYGRVLGFQKLHEILNRLNRDPFQQINMRLDALIERVSKDDDENDNDKNAATLSSLKIRGGRSMSWEDLRSDQTTRRRKTTPTANQMVR